MQTLTITSDVNMKTRIFGGLIEDPQMTALWEDPDFGLKNINNYLRWDAMMYGREPIIYTQLANELKTHFGLTQEAIDFA